MSDKNDTYSSRLAAAAPAFALKPFISDMPKGAVEYAVQRKVSGDKTPMQQLLRKGVAGRGVGRAAGGMLGITMAPLFLKGIQLSNSKNKSDRNKGLAYLASSAAGAAGLKGLTEGAREASVSSKATGKAFKSGLERGTIKAMLKAPQSLVVGMSIAKGRKNKKDDVSKYLLPALTTSALSGATKGAEAGISAAARGARGAKLLKKIMPGAAGGAASGLLGGALLAGITDMAMKPLKKTAGPRADLVKKVLQSPVTQAAAKAALAKGVGAFKKRQALKAAGKAVKTGRKTGTVLKDAVQSWKGMQSRRRSRQMGIGIREGVAGRRSSGKRAKAILALTLSPSMHAERTVGRKIGRTLRALPEGKREEALRMLQRASKHPVAANTLSGKKTPVVRSMSEGIDMALGSTPLYRKSKNKGVRVAKKAWEGATLGGRDIGGKGLPMARKSDSVVTLSKKNREFMANSGVQKGLLEGLGIRSPSRKETRTRKLVNALMPAGNYKREAGELMGRTIRHGGSAGSQRAALLGAARKQQKAQSDMNKANMAQALRARFIGR